MRILLIEDEDVSAEMLEQVLSEAGHAVSVPKNVNEVFTEISRFRPHLIITDYNLGGISGADLGEMLRKHNRKVPFILITGYPLNQVMPHFKALNPIMAFEKPIDTKALVDYLSSIEIGLVTD